MRTADPQKTRIGSPPLARGTASEAKKEWKRIGITPACAGNRYGQSLRIRAEEDHPRLRGEQKYIPDDAQKLMGSPPLARGTDCPIKSTRYNTRITPACAGNSRHRRKNTVQSRDHPRLRGEQGRRQKARGGIWGSPPLARGTACAAIPRHGRARITPACAGNRTEDGIADFVDEDHPRLRGEQFLVLRGDCGSSGSPPLARGTGT